MESGKEPEVLSAGTLIGEPVVNPSGEEVGTIEELMIDLASGDIAYAVLSLGATFGREDRLYAIPWGLLQRSRDHDGFLIESEGEIVAAAPGFDRGNWPRMADQAWAEKVHQYFGQVPYWQRSYYADRPTGPTQMGGHKKPSPFH